MEHGPMMPKMYTPPAADVDGDDCPCHFSIDKQAAEGSLVSFNGISDSITSADGSLSTTTLGGVVDDVDFLGQSGRKANTPPASPAGTKEGHHKHREPATGNDVNSNSTNVVEDAELGLLCDAVVSQQEEETTAAAGSKEVDTDNGGKSPAPLTPRGSSRLHPVFSPAAMMICVPPSQQYEYPEGFTIPEDPWTDVIRVEHHVTTFRNK